MNICDSTRDMENFIDTFFLESIKNSKKGSYKNMPTSLIFMDILSISPLFCEWMIFLVDLSPVLRKNLSWI